MAKERTSAATAAPISAEVGREALLVCLHLVESGLSKRELLEQSSCFVFQRGRVVTFNDEISCRCRSGLPKELTGAVPAKPLLELLEKLPDEKVKFVQSDEGLRLAGVKGSKWKSSIRMESEVLLAVENVEEPAKDSWRPLPEDFGTAMRIVTACAGTDDSRFYLTCVHFNKSFLEACDNFQLARYEFKNAKGKKLSLVETPFLIRRDAAVAIAALGMNELAETDNWAHFRGPNGLTLSCRRYLEEYPSLDELLQVEGRPLVLPGSIPEAVGCAEVFSSESADDNKVMVEIKPGTMIIKGVGSYGWFEKPLELGQGGYKGEPLQFLIDPKLLVEISGKYKACHVAEERLKVDGESYTYVSCLSKVPDEDERANEEAVDVRRARKKQQQEEEDESGADDEGEGDED